MQKINIDKTDEVKKQCNKIILLDHELKSALKELSEVERDYIRKEFENKNYQVFLNRYSEWIIIQSFDKTKNANSIKEQLRKGGASICNYIQKTKSNKVQILDYYENPSYTKALVEGISLGMYQFKKYFKDSTEKEAKLNTIYVNSSDISQKEWDNLSEIIQAVYFTRDLVNEPPSILTAKELVDEIQIRGKNTGLKIEIFDKEKITALKMNGLLAVNKGSILPPFFTVITWKPENAVNTNPVVLVGKGIVYDTGGYSLKPTPDSMDYMKCDMAGAATVASVMLALSKNNIPAYCMALIPSTDNHIGASAYAPGDIITYSDGTSVEVLNTDAEGRLVLADALLYAKQFKPELTITIATLTGSAQRAIGTQAMVGMGNIQEDIIKQITQTGEETHERVAIFPFWDEYKDSLKSEIADLKNLGGDSAGAITAGKFLEHFTDYPFFHLDIAGVAFFKKQDNYRSSGGTGIGVRLLYHFIENFINLR